mgnify:CR=1 FL=1
MGAKRKVSFTRDGVSLQFDSFSDARRYFGITSGNFPDYALKLGYYKGWKVEAGETPYHGMYGTPLYGSWAAMKTRCTNENIPSWKDYGGRGIKLCNEWEEFIPFMEWAMSNGYKDGLTIERKDVNGNYCPENCCWVTRADQQKNKRTSRKFEINGETKILADLSNEHSISIATVSHRLDFGWSIEDALTKEPKKFPKGFMIAFCGETLSARQWGKRTGLLPSTIISRIKHGWTVEDALTTPPDVRNRKQKENIKWRR